MSYPLALAVAGILSLGVEVSTLLPAQLAYSTTISQNNAEQKIKQNNIGSGSSDNLNCGANVSDSNLFEEITCSIEGETPTPGMTAIRPVVTQRMAEIPVVPSGTTSGEAQCNPDEVVTGGGYEISELRSSGTGGPGGSLPPPTVYYTTSFKEFAENNAWHIEIVNPSLTGSVRVYAECLKLVPA